MSTHQQDGPRPLPERPNLRHLKDQAKDLLRAGAAKTLADAQFQVARMYGFASWPKLKVHIESLEDIGRLKDAIDANDLDRVRNLMTRNPGLHTAPLGYGKSGPLTWVAECRVPREAPRAARLAMAKWMIDNGSDVHQGGDGPLCRAALFGQRIPMMELLLACGADVNALWNGRSPIIFAPCETVEPAVIQWLLDHGANPNNDRYGRPRAALNYLIGSYSRSPQLAACIDILLNAGAVTKYDDPVILDLLRGRLDAFAKHLDANPALLNKQFPDLDFGATGGRRLTLRGATLLHVAAEYGNLQAAALLLDRGAQINARAAIDDSGVGGQTPLFHAASQFGEQGLAIVKLLLERGADLSVRAKLPGHYERLEEIVECTPLGYALLFPEDGTNPAIGLLGERGAKE